MAPEGRVEEIQYVVFVPPEGYYSLPTSAARAELAGSIGAIECHALKDRSFHLYRPGRWGTSTPTWACRSAMVIFIMPRALVELTGTGIGPAPEPSFGTHFFQDLVESNIYPLAVDLDDPETQSSTTNSSMRLPNQLAEFLPEMAEIGQMPAGDPVSPAIAQDTI